MNIIKSLAFVVLLAFLFGTVCLATDKERAVLIGEFNQASCFLPPPFLRVMSDWIQMTNP